jgi:hypothetical protein
MLRPYFQMLDTFKRMNSLAHLSVARVTKKKKFYNAVCQNAQSWLSLRQLLLDRVGSKLVPTQNLVKKVIKNTFFSSSLTTLQNKLECFAQT